MANLFTPASPATGPWYIDREDCIGDSLSYINANTNYFGTNLQSLNSLILSLSSQIVGVNQNWQDLLSSRAINTAYTNNTGKTIAVCIGWTNQNTTNNTTFVVNGVTVATFEGPGAGGYLYSTGNILVPNGAIYQFNTAGGFLSLNSWAELR